MRLTLPNLLMFAALLFGGVEAKADDWVEARDGTSASTLALSSHSLLSRELRDYQNTRFRNVSAHYSTEKNGRHYFLCGELNAPNQFGGYTGWRPFGIWGYPEGGQSLWIADPLRTSAIMRTCYGFFPTRVDDATKADYTSWLAAMSPSE